MRGEMEPLSQLRVWEDPASPAVGLAGRLLAGMGAAVDIVEPAGGSPLRRLPPFLDGGESALFAYLADGTTVRAAADAPVNELDDVHVVLAGEDGVPGHWAAALGSSATPERGRAVLVCSPYGSTGPKSSWSGSELTLFQAGGEGYLTPSGLSYEQFPDRPPLAAARYVASYQAGLTVALVALGALRLSRVTGRTEYAEVSIQEAQLSLNYMVLSRHVDGTLERRSNRAFSYGGILPCRDGHVELVAIEQHQWDAVRAMLGDPAWAREERFQDGMSRGHHGAEINGHLRAWAAERTTAEVVAAAKEHDVPCGAFVAPQDLPDSPQLQSRGFFRAASAGHRGADRFPGLPWIIEDGDADAR